MVFAVSCLTYNSIWQMISETFLQASIVLILTNVNISVIERVIQKFHITLATNGITGHSAIAFRGQSRSPDMVPFDMLGMVSY